MREFVIFHRTSCVTSAFTDPATKECVSTGDKDKLAFSVNKPLSDFLAEKEKKKGIKLSPGTQSTLTQYSKMSK